MKQLSSEALASECITQSTTSGESSLKQNPLQNESNQDDEWLSYYMFGKIKEKLECNIFETLACYLKVD